MNEAVFNTLVLRESDEEIHVRLNRPEVRNAIDAEMAEELHGVCELLEADPRILTIAGGEGIFAAGADIGELRERNRGDALRGINSSLFARIRKLPMPTIAVVDGHALGGGAELAYACDFRLGSPRARFGNPETGLGILAAAGATWRLLDLVGEPLAKEMLMAGRILDAEESLVAGLLSRVVPSEELDEAAEALRARLAAQAPLALQLTKKVLHAPREAHPVIDDIAQAVLFETEEKRQRMTKFLERSGRGGHGGRGDAGGNPPATSAARPAGGEPR